MSVSRLVRCKMPIGRLAFPGETNAPRQPSIRNVYWRKARVYKNAHGFVGTEFPAEFEGEAR